MDYELTLKIRNAPLLNLMRSAGYNNAAELSRACGLSQNLIGDFLNLKTPAYRKDGVTPRGPVIKLAEFLNASYTELFPEDHLYNPLVKNKFHAQVTTYQLEQLTNASQEDPCRLLEIMETEGRKPFDEMIDDLPLREKNILTLRMEQNMTYEEIGKVYDITGQRVRQIEFRAIKKLRHPGRKERIIESAGVYADNYQ